MVTMMGFLSVGLIVFVLYVLVRLRYHPLLFFGGRRLPPGSMGLPYIGQTLQLYSQNPNFFFSAKQKRYGEIFKTHILGCPCIMIASPEAARFVLVSHARLFKPTFPASKEKMIGPNALFFHQGDYHARLRKLVQRSFFPEAIREVVPDIESLALTTLQSWEGRTINTFHEMRKFAFDVGILSIFGQLEVPYKEDLKSNYYLVEKGYNSLPINLPGTLYNKASRARKHLSEILSNIIAERRLNNAIHKDLLGTLMEFEDLSDDQIADNIIGVLFAAQDTTASAEQEAIQRAKRDGNTYLTWEDTKKMRFTSRVDFSDKWYTYLYAMIQVIQETLRIASILSFTFREATEDVEYKGYLIPKGWKVLPLFRNIHHSPEFFPDPQEFDPSRFEVPPKPNTFLPFGNGAHSCPGNELAKLEMLILIHYLTTKYRVDVVGSETGIQYGPFPVPKQGLPVTVRRKMNPCHL
eukprot:Gb_17626 [translate_table: standard]